MKEFLFGLLVVLLFHGCTSLPLSQHETSKESLPPPPVINQRPPLLVVPIKMEFGLLNEDFEREVIEQLISSFQKNAPEFLLVTNSKEWEIRQKNQEGGLILKSHWKNFDIRVQTKSVGVIRSQRVKVDLVWEFQVESVKTERTEYRKIKKIALERGDWRASRDLSEDLLREEYLKSRGAELLKEIEDLFLTVASEIRWLARERSWEGRVAYIQGSRIYLNIGEKSGLRVGDILKVTELGEEVFDPQSGDFIGRTPGRVKGTIEIVGFFGEDGSIAIIHSGGGFKENDRVSMDW